MIALDTNVLVRLLVEDDARQLRSAQTLLRQAQEAEETVLLTDILLCELAWVLDAAYGVPRERILAAVQMLLGDDRFCFEDRGLVERALTAYQQGRGDLSDSLLGLRAEKQGSRTTFTFDRGLRSEAELTLLR